MDDFLNTHETIIDQQTRPCAEIRGNVGMTLRTAGGEAAPSRKHSIAPIAAADVHRNNGKRISQPSCLLTVHKFILERSHQNSTVSMKMWYCHLSLKC